MSKVGDRVKCPKCRREARVVWVSQDGKTVAIRCTGYHSHLSLPPTGFRKKCPNQDEERDGIPHRSKLGARIFSPLFKDARAFSALETI